MSHVCRAALLAAFLTACSQPAPEPGPTPAPPGPPSGPVTMTPSDPEPSEPAPDPDPDPAPAPDPAPESELPPPFAKVLASHNAYRAKHCAPPLEWSDEIADVAQSWAEKLRDAGCAFEHSRTRYGENLAAGSAHHLSPSGVVDMWYREIADYDWSDPRFGMSTGHFTQVVWAGSTKLGCGVTRCRDMLIWVCNYDPPGNVQGAFRRNVDRPGRCR